MGVVIPRKSRQRINPNTNPCYTLLYPSMSRHVAGRRDTGSESLDGYVRPPMC